MANETLDDIFKQGGLKEDQTTEFKTSIFIDAESRTPGTKQMHKIADTMAAFMNADGGVIYIGIKDGGKEVTGIAKDLAVLATMASSVVVMSSRGNDKDFKYGPTEDKFELKVRAIAKSYMSPNARMCIESVCFEKYNNETVCLIKCKPCAPDDIVYTYRKYGQDKPEIAEIFVRCGNQKVKLDGESRDDFVRRRFRAGIESQLAAVRASVAQTDGSSGNAELVSSVQALLGKLDGRTLEGAKVTVVGAHEFTEEAISAAAKPKTIVWNGGHYADVSSWKELVLKVLEKLQELNAAKFDELADTKEFGKILVKIKKPKEKHSDCFATRFGANNSIRVKSSVGNKVYLYRTDFVLRKLISAFEVDVSRFMFTAE